MSPIYLNIQTGAMAEILAEDPDSITFRTLPVGRPNTVPRETFLRVFKPKQETDPSAPATPNQTPEPSSPEPPNPPKRPARYRDRRAYYQANREKLKAKSLSHYYFTKLILQTTQTPEGKKLAARKAARKRAYYKLWWLKNKDRVNASRRKADRSGQELENSAPDPTPAPPSSEA